MTRREFPCFACKGRGEWTDVILDDGTGPREYCGVCDAKGTIVIGSKEHLAVLQGAVRGWLSERTVRKGDDWDCDDKWQGHFNAAYRLCCDAVELLLAAKVEHYFGVDEPGNVPLPSATAPLVASEIDRDACRIRFSAFEEEVRRLSYSDAADRDNPRLRAIWKAAMASTYGKGWDGQP